MKSPQTRLDDPGGDRDARLAPVPPESTSGWLTPSSMEQPTPTGRGVLHSVQGGTSSSAWVERSTEPLLLTTVEAAQRLGIGRCTMQHLVNEGKIRSLKIGALRRIPAAALGEYIERESRGGCPTPPS